MTFEEALATITQDPSICLTGLGLSTEGKVSIYTIDSDAEDPKWINVHFEASTIFSSEAEEEVYEAADAPSDAYRLKYLDLAEKLRGEGATESALYLLFPNDLPKPWLGTTSKQAFLRKALEVAAASDFITVI